MKISGIPEKDRKPFEEWVKRKYKKSLEQIWDEEYEKEYSSADADNLIELLYEEYLVKTSV